MAKTKILFRADSSQSIGIGHIMRDLVLASLFKKAQISFATLDLESNINHKIQKAGHKLEILKSNTKEELLALIHKLDIDILVIDHYQIGYEYETYIRENSAVSILCLDDIYKRHNCHILLNHNIYADKKKYKILVPKNCEILCGAKYTLLRDEFHKVKKTKRIFIAMGGLDHSNINIKILKALKKFNNIKVHLVTNSSNKNLKTLQKYVKNKKWVKLHIDSKKIAKLMRKSDMGIISASVTANEAHFMKLPFISIKTAKNQNEMHKYLNKNNYLTLNSFNPKELQNKVNLLLKGLKNA